MKRFLILVCALGLTVGTGQAQTLFVSPDVPTEPDGTVFLPWETVRHSSGAGYGLELAIPGDPAIDALHKMDAAGNWLFSVEVPNDLAGSLSTEAEPRDVIRFDAGGGLLSRFFCGGTVADPVPLDSNVDAVYLEGGDPGDIVVSFDVPTTIGSSTFQPTALVRYERFAPGCSGWKLVGLVIDVAGSIAIHPEATNLIGAARGGGGLLMALDVPTDLAPSIGPPTYLPGHIVSFNGLAYDLFEDLQLSGAPGWPVSSLVDALSCGGNPGRIDAAIVEITMDKATLPDVTLYWPASCSSGAEDYGIYEGSLTSVRTGVYDHVAIDCVDGGTALEEDVTPAATDSYYLIVPHNNKDEGAYGEDSTAALRPQAAGIPSRCVATQLVTPCP